jgi:hypothetical protein
MIHIEMNDSNQQHKVEQESLYSRMRLPYFGCPSSTNPPANHDRSSEQSQKSNQSPQFVTLNQVFST